MDHTPETPATPAGWYDDGSGTRRWWDGTAWTDRFEEPVLAPESTADVALPAPAPVVGKSRLGIWALVLGIIAMVFAVIPGLSFIAGMPALAALTVGIIALVRRTPRRGKPITGVVLGGSALIVSIVVSASFASTVGRGFNDGVNPVAGPPTSSPSAEPIEEPSAPASEPPAALDLASYAETTDRDLALLAKNPDSSAGSSLIVYGYVTQFDAATGPCNFRADVSAGIKEVSYEYEYNSILGTADDSDCPILDAVVQGDAVKIWVTSLGSYSYDTQVGGSTTVPSFRVDQIEILPATEY